MEGRGCVDNNSHPENGSRKEEVMEKDKKLFVSFSELEKADD